MADTTELSFDEESGYTGGAFSEDSINNPVSGWDPSSVTPGATSWGDVATKGISRLVDAVTRPAQLTNTQPVLAKPATQRNNTGAAPAPINVEAKTLMMVIVAAIVAIALLHR